MIKKYDKLIIEALENSKSTPYCKWSTRMQTVANQIGHKEFESICGDMITPCNNDVGFISGVCYRLRQDWS